MTGLSDKSDEEDADPFKLHKTSAFGMATTQSFNDSRMTAKSNANNESGIDESKRSLLEKSGRMIGRDRGRSRSDSDGIVNQGPGTPPSPNEIAMQIREEAK